MASEWQAGQAGQPAWRSAYAYDRWGNRYQHAADNGTSPLPYTPVEAADVDRATNRFVDPMATSAGVE